MKILLLTFLLIASTSAFSQHFSYRYNGSVSEQNSLVLQSKITSFNYFTDVKIKQKNQSGELFFTIPTREQKSEEEPPYTIIDIKSLLLEFGLTPDSFVIIER